MARCPSCDYPIPDDRDRAGARCPSCHDPIYEPPTRVARAARPDEAACARHPAMESVGQCARCRQHLCETCRTRWRTQIVCAACVELAFNAAEATPAQAQATQNQAYASVALGGSAWVGAALALFLATRASMLGEYAHVLLLACVVLVAALALAASVGVGQA